jgi:hypothetical protein
MGYGEGLGLRHSFTPVTDERPVVVFASNGAYVAREVLGAPAARQGCAALKWDPMIISGTRIDHAIRQDFLNAELRSVWMASPCRAFRLALTPQERFERLGFG